MPSSVAKVWLGFCAAADAAAVAEAAATSLALGATTEVSACWLQPANKRLPERASRRRDVWERFIGFPWSQ